ncbi:MAG: glycosyltransferase [Comamonas sp.]|nr:glycosyltransferase [Comamonas sp.]
MNKPILTLITTSFPISGDGSEAAGAFVADFAEELAKHVRVHVVAPGSHDIQERWSDNVQIFRFIAPSKPLSTLNPWRPTDALSTFQVLRSGMRATHLAAQGSSHILALWALPCGAWAKRAAKELGISYSVWMLGSDVWTLGRIPVIRYVLARVIQQAKNAYADGYLLAKDAEKIADRPIAFLPSTRRIGMVQYPAPRSQPPYRLLFLGRWHPNKGIDLLLEALHMLTDVDWQQIEVVEIQGGGPMHAQVKVAIDALQAQGRPVVQGRYLARAEAEASIARADWVLIPSRIESIPVVFSDAMKMMRPVVAMPVGDLPKLLQRQLCGILTTKVTADAYSIALRHAIKSSTANYLKGAQAHAQNFDLPLLSNDLIKELIPDE